VLGAYDSDYANFRISGVQADALQSLLRFTQSSQIPVVFINLPLTEDYLDPVRLEHEQAFQDYMVQLGLTQPGFIFRDLSQQWTTQYSYFSDPSHLNRYGAHAVSLKLAQDAKIPWTKLKQPTPEKPIKQAEAAEPLKN
jgi:poly-D-alanine transfer protein DltD